MTAEVAILNKSAIAIAADSAGSIGAHPNLKIYNSFNKIFELSDTHPIAIMVYGNLEFMGLPLEVLIKQYRKLLGSKSFDHVSDFALDFYKYLETCVPINDTDVIFQIRSMLFDPIKILIESINKNFIDAYKSNRNNFSQKEFSQSAKTTISSNIENIKERYNKIDEIEELYISKSCKNEIDDLIDMHFTPFKLTLANRRLIYKYAGMFTSRDISSQASTGIVITGFGEKDLCPSLSWVEIDGLIDGKLKVIQKKYVDIGRTTEHAQVMGFAQSDMIKSFVNGVDPAVEQYFLEQNNEAVWQSTRIIIDEMRKNVAISEESVNAIVGGLSGLQGDLRRRALAYTQTNFETPLLDMIRHMPKQEMAALASSLIEITSLKRKVTRVQETVGGEVDVAIISKAEGFVWVKRKHYFSPEVNPRYFSRAYNN